MLQKAECHAQTPNQVSRALAKIVEENPDLIEAHFLDFLNCLRVREYCGALQASIVMHGIINQAPQSYAMDT